MRIVETDNFGGDYPNEKFLDIPRMDARHAYKVASAINGGFPVSCPRYWKVVEDDYVSKPGFEP